MNNRPYLFSSFTVRLCFWHSLSSSEREHSALSGGLREFLSVCPAEPQPVPHLLREDPRPPLLHGGPLSGGHEDLDGCDRYRSRGIHTVPELSGNLLQGLTAETLQVLPVSSPARTQSFFLFLISQSFLCRCFHLHVQCVSVGSKRELSHTHTHLCI